MLKTGAGLMTADPGRIRCPHKVAGLPYRSSSDHFLTKHRFFRIANQGSVRPGDEATPSPSGLAIAFDPTLAEGGYIRV